MSNEDNVQNFSPPIKPSARRNIHDHECCIFSANKNFTMNNKLLIHNNKRTEHISQENNQGFDVVDQGMSKFAYRPQSLRSVAHGTQKIAERRNSINPSEQSSTDDSDDSNVLSKSLPATFSSYDYSNDKAFKWRNESYPSHNSTSSVNRSQDYLLNSSIEQESAPTYGTEGKTQQENLSFLYRILPSVIIILIAIMICCYYKFLSHSTFNSIEYNELNIIKEFNYIGEKYKINYDSILELRTGISTIFERNDTSSFIFIYDSQLNNYDRARFTNFLEDVSITAARYLRNNSKSIQPTILHSSQLNMETHSELMNKYRHEIDKSGVMLVLDIDNVPSNLVMAFHYFCDEYNPLVAKTAVFFTLNLANCSIPSDRKCTYLDIENCLKKKWTSLPKENIKPLLSRVVNVIVDVSGISKTSFANK